VGNGPRQSQWRERLPPKGNLKNLRTCHVSNGFLTVRVQGSLLGPQWMSWGFRGRLLLKRKYFKDMSRKSWLPHFACPGQSIGSWVMIELGFRRKTSLKTKVFCVTCMTLGMVASLCVSRAACWVLSDWAGASKKKFSWKASILRAYHVSHGCLTLRV